MIKNPLINALAAAIYINLIASVMFYSSKSSGHDNSVIAPIAVLSLFTFSAAVMGYIFLFQPLQLYFDGKKKDAVRLFLQTMAAFGGLTALFMVLLFFSTKH